MAAGGTYEPIATYTVTSNQQTITFTSIPSTYTDLRVVCSLKNSGPATGLDGYMRINSDSASNYSTIALYGQGTAAYCSRSSNQTYCMWPVDSETNFNIFRFEINNYANTSKYKTVLLRSDQTNYGAFFTAFLWRSNAAINALSFTSADATGGTVDYFVPGSTITIYGITAA